MSKRERLVDHALVMNHVQAHVIGHRAARHRLRDILLGAGAAPDQLPLEDMEIVGAGEAIIIAGAPHHAGDGKFIEVAWACGCGEALHANPDRLLATWARHVERLCDIDADHLEQHFLAALRGFIPTAVCACGDTFSAPPDDSMNSDRALEGWERHVRELK